MHSGIAISMCFFENHRLSSSLPPSASVSQRSQVQAPAFLGSWQRYNVKRTPPPERNKLQVEQSPQISIFMGATNPKFQMPGLWHGNFP